MVRQQKKSQSVFSVLYVLFSVKHTVVKVKGGVFCKGILLHFECGMYINARNVYCCGAFNFRKSSVSLAFI